MSEDYINVDQTILCPFWSATAWHQNETEGDINRSSVYLHNVCDHSAECLHSVTKDN